MLARMQEDLTFLALVFCSLFFLCNAAPSPFWRRLDKGPSAEQSSNATLPTTLSSTTSSAQAASAQVPSASSSVEPLNEKDGAELPASSTLATTSATTTHSPSPQVNRWQCASWPTSSGSAQERCENGNALYNGYKYLYNAGADKDKPGLCGIGGCGCCYRLQGLWKWTCTNWPTSNGSAPERCENGNALQNGYEYLYNVGADEHTSGACGIARCECCARQMQLAYEARPAREYKQLGNQDFQVAVQEGTAIDEGSGTKSSLEECQLACDNTFGCQSFAWCPKYQKICALKQKVFDGSEPTRHKNGKCKTYYTENTSPQAHSKREYKKLSNEDWHVAVDEGKAIDEGSGAKNSLEECKNACDVTIGCQSFAWCPKYYSFCSLKEKAFTGSEPTRFKNGNCDTYFVAAMQSSAAETTAAPSTVQAISARRSWRLANSGPAPSSGHWSVYELDFFRNYTVGANDAVYCHDELEAHGARILSSGFLNLWSNFAPENAFEDLVEIGKGWNSQRHSGPFQAWIGLEFSMPTEVRCLRLYQSGLKHRRWGSFGAQSVTLQKFVESSSETIEGTWETVYTWAAEDANALPGWTWTTLPVGLKPQHAFSECPTATRPRDYKTCCVWPHLAVPGFSSLSRLSFEERNDTVAHQQCSPLATVSSGRACKIKSAHCGVSGEIKCKKGKVQLQMFPQFSKPCVKKEMKAVKHGGSPMKYVDYQAPEAVRSPVTTTLTKKTTTMPPSSDAAQAWRLANGGPPPSSGHWVVHQLVMFQSFTVDSSGNVFCHNRLDAATARVISSGFSNYFDQYRPENAFDAFQIGEGWQSQRHKRAYEAWIGLEFSVPAEVKCIRLYQSGVNTASGTFSAQNVVLQKFEVPEGGSSSSGGRPAAPEDGEWKSVASWGVPGRVAMPGLTWLTLAVGLSPSHAFTECTRMERYLQYRPWYKACCIWPQLHAADGSSLKIAEDDAELPQCSPLATVSENRSCAVRSAPCGVIGQMTCTGGHVKLSFHPAASWLDLGGRCIQEEFEHVKHAGSPLTFFVENLTSSEFAAPVEVQKHSLFTILGFVVAFVVLAIVIWSIIWWRSAKHHFSSAAGELEMQNHEHNAEAFSMPSVIGSPIRYMRLK